MLQGHREIFSFQEISRWRKSRTVVSPAAVVIVVAAAVDCVEIVAVVDVEDAAAVVHSQDKFNSTFSLKGNDEQNVERRSPTFFLKIFQPETKQKQFFGDKFKFIRCQLRSLRQQ